MTQSNFSFFARNMFEEERPELAFAPGALLLPAFALDIEEPLLAALGKVIEAAPFRHMVTPGGHRMSVAMTNCGPLG